MKLTIQPIKPEIEDHFTIGLRKREYDEQRRIEAIVQKHDQSYNKPKYGRNIINDSNHRINTGTQNSRSA